MNKTCLAFLTALIAFSITGCNKKPADSNALYKATFSPVYQEFDIVPLAEPQTIHPRDYDKQGSWNTASLKGRNKYSAVMPAQNGTDSPKQILQKIDKFVKSRTSNISIEGTSPNSLDGTEKYIYTLWMYNWQKRHGQLHVWLFPSPDKTQIGMAVYHHEEPLE